MTESVRDRWAEWLLRRGTAGDKQGWVNFLRPIRDRVLDNAQLAAGETLLDVGAGDGLIAFGALDKLGEQGRVILGDVSRDLLDHSRSLAEEMGVADRCGFLHAPATDLSALEDACVDVVTTRSVLIYVKDKRRAFEEFYRVLKSGGRLSIFEPIGSFKHPEPPHLFEGCDVSPVQELAGRVRGVYERIQPRDSHPMFDFDERDLLRCAEEAGFEKVRLDYLAEIAPGNPPGWQSPAWDILARAAPNPLVPSLEEAVDETLTPEEAERFMAYLKPLVEEGKRVRRHAKMYLRAVKAE
ncbi:MAG: class I SAM-dependent methyltransferase [Rubrobacter sp.]